jgi:hypothetical protein
MSFKTIGAAALIAAVVSLAPLHTAQAESVRVAIDGIGGSNCSTIMANLKDNPQGAAHAVTGWTFGYMSRRNIERGLANKSQVDFKAFNLDQQKVLNFVVGACEKVPELRLFEIADALYEGLLTETPIA